MEVVQGLILGHEILDSVIDLLAGLDDHVVDVHVRLGAVGLLDGNGSVLQLLDSLQSVLLAGDVLILSLCHLLSLLLKINNFDVGHEDLGVSFEAFNSFNCLDEGLLFVARKLHLHDLLVFLKLGVLVECTIRFLKLAQLIGDVLSTKSQSIMLKLIDDVCEVLFLLNENLLHLNAVLSASLSTSAVLLSQGTAHA